MNFKREIPTTYLSAFTLSSLLVLIFLDVLLHNLPSNIQRAGDKLLYLNASEGVANAVTSVVVYFRGFDTLGEVTVLFIVSIGVGAMVKLGNEFSIKAESNFMLQVGARLLFPIILLLGVYIIIYGHLSPGGGFQGGVIIASAILLLLISQNKFIVSHAVISFFEMLAGASYVIMGLIGILVADVFLGNFLPHDISQMGFLISGGIIPLIYIVIGMKVGSEMSLIVQSLLKREDNV